MHAAASTASRSTSSPKRVGTVGSFTSLALKARGRKVRRLDGKAQLCVLRAEAMIANQCFGRSVLAACMIAVALTLFGCVIAAVPLIIYATKGSSTSTATVSINRDAATVYANAVKVVKQRGYTQITKQDDAKYFLEGTRNGKNLTLQVSAAGSDQSRIILTIENDKDNKDINEAVEALLQTCRQLGVQCEQQKS